MLQQLRLFFVALQFLTRCPTPAWVGFDPAWLNASARYFPLVGSGVGGLAAGVLWGAAALFAAPAVVALLSIAATVLATGAFHEDGLADTCDALGGAVGRERALEIMKDSRIGSYGAVGLVLILGLKAATLAGLLTASLPAAAWATVLAHTASRSVPVWLIHRLAYAGSLAHAKAKPLAQGVSGRELAVALAVPALLGGLCVVIWPGADLAVAMSAAAAFGVALASGRWLRHRLGGYTGDTLGAAQQVSEVAILLAWLAVAPRLSA